MRYLIVVVLFLSACDAGTKERGYWTPEAQGAMAKRCKANNMDWHIVDYGRVVCHKKEQP
jgi:hypothetical protein